jgi:hypothetical protein
MAEYIPSFEPLSFSEPVSFEGPNAALLPQNYAEAALSEAIGRGTGRSRLILALPDGDRPARYAAISAVELSDPRLLTANLKSLGLSPSDPWPRSFLGPETDLKPVEPETNQSREVFEIRGQPWSLIEDRQITETVVIIDAGIAFWNSRFRGKSGPRFRGMRYLDYDGPPMMGQFNELTDTEIASLCAMADRDGNAAVMRHLGTTFPHSVFGPESNPSADGFWHGTAVADLAVGVHPDGRENAADGIALFGLELPRTVIADYSGSTLTPTLAMILPAAIEMTKNLADVPLTIVMPLGFPGGPQDGSHAAARAIESAMTSAGRNNIRLVLPAGNHLQDRCHARLLAGTDKVRVHWDLAPEDHSDNVVTLIGPAGADVELTIKAPGESAPASAVLQPATQYFVEWNGQRIGLLLRGADTAPWSNTKVSLFGTAEVYGTTTTPPGRWSVTNTGQFPLNLWLARDDYNPVADRGRARRPSWFWDAAYTQRDSSGALVQTDDAGSVILRSGTLSALATARGATILVVQADERLGSGPEGPAGYCSRPEVGTPLTERALVDDGWPGRGTLAAANGGTRRVHVSGTSAAAGLKARALVLPGVPPNP